MRNSFDRKESGRKWYTKLALLMLMPGITVGSALPALADDSYTLCGEGYIQAFITNQPKEGVTGYKGTAYNETNLFVTLDTMNDSGYPAQFDGLKWINIVWNDTDRFQNLATALKSAFFAGAYVSITTKPGTEEYCGTAIPDNLSIRVCKTSSQCEASD